MRQYSDYDEIKRELEIMKVSHFTHIGKPSADTQYVEFSGADFETDGDEDIRLPDPNASIANQRLGRSLENLLVLKNRRLLEDLTKLRVSYDDLSGQYNTSAEMLEGLQSDLARQKGLNEKLENDLFVVNKPEDKPRDGSGLAGLDIGNKSDGRASPGPAVNGESSILPIVTSQRDRFRQRNGELEEVSRKLRSASLGSSCRSLESNSNLSLISGPRSNPYRRTT